MVFCVNEARVKLSVFRFCLYNFSLQGLFSLLFPCANVPCTEYLGDGRRSEEVQDFATELNTEANGYQGQAKNKEIYSKARGTVEEA